MSRKLTTMSSSSSSRSNSFALDRRNGKLMGVCAGFSRWTGLNSLFVRLGLVGLTVFVFGPLAILAYLLVGWIAN